MKIFCVGKNYAAHAKEMGGELPEAPVIFMKPDTAAIYSGETFYYPSFSKIVHYEVELVVKICKTGKYIEEKFANKYYTEVGVGIDFTARDLQTELKAKGLPWEISKSFNGSAAISEFVSLEAIRPMQELYFSLDKNGQMVQKGFCKDMIFSVDAIIAYISRFFLLKQGDLIFTGTPAGVGPVIPGDVLKGYLNEAKLLEITVK